MINRKIAASLLALVMLVSMIALSACGSNDADSDDPNLGVWNATTGEMLGMSMDITDFFGEGFTIELKSGGKCTLFVDGDKSNGKWTLDDGAFTVSGGGFDGSGTLENGSLVLEDVLGMGLTITFEKEGGSSGTTAGTAQKPGADNDGPVGVWIGKSVIIPGEEPSDSFMGMMAASDCIYMELKADGSVRLQYIGEIVDTTWEKNGANNGTIDFSGMPVDFELKAGELHLYIGEKGGAESVEFVLEPSSKSFDELAEGIAGGSTEGAIDADSNPYSHPELLTTFEGDWYGVIHFESAYGEYEDLADVWSSVIARFTFNEGECGVYMAIELNPGNAHLNFTDLTARMGSIGIVVNGSFLDMPFDENTVVCDPTTGEPAQLYLTGNADEYGYEATVYLHPWGIPWDVDTRYAPDDVSSRDFDEVAAEYNADTSIIPYPTYESDIYGSW